MDTRLPPEPHSLPPHSLPSRAHLSRELVARAPKVLLHEHLDGGLRPRTVLELAHECGYTELPTQDEAALADWFAAGAARGSLPLYLEGFRHTIALLQTAKALERVAYEFVEDMARNLKPAKAIGMTTVWVDNGSEQHHDADRSYVDFVTDDITRWLEAALESA